MHQLAVADTVLTGTRVNPGNPQFTEVALVSLAVTECVQTALHNLVLGSLEQTVLGTSVTLSQLHDALTTCARNSSTLNSHSGILLDCLKII